MWKPPFIFALTLILNMKNNKLTFYLNCLLFKEKCSPLNLNFTKRQLAALVLTARWYK